MGTSMDSSKKFSNVQCVCSDRAAPSPVGAPELGKALETSPEHSNVDHGFAAVFSYR